MEDGSGLLKFDDYVTRPFHNGTQKKPKKPLSKRQKDMIIKLKGVELFSAFLSILAEKGLIPEDEHSTLLMEEHPLFGEFIATFHGACEKFDLATKDPKKIAKKDHQGANAPKTIGFYFFVFYRSHLHFILKPATEKRKLLNLHLEDSLPSAEDDSASYTSEPLGLQVDNLQMLELLLHYPLKVAASYLANISYGEQKTEHLSKKEKVQYKGLYRDMLQVESYGICFSKLKQIGLSGDTMRLGIDEDVLYKYWVKRPPATKTKLSLEATEAISIGKSLKTCESVPNLTESGHMISEVEGFSEILSVLYYAKDKEVIDQKELSSVSALINDYSCSVLWHLVSALIKEKPNFSITAPVDEVFDVFVDYISLRDHGFTPNDFKAKILEEALSAQGKKDAQVFREYWFSSDLKRSYLSNKKDSEIIKVQLLGHLIHEVSREHRLSICIKDQEA